VYYNEIIFISPNGTAGMRAKRQFTHGRKVVKTHQNIVMFVKGKIDNDNYNICSKTTEGTT